jgi:glycosyltransferase involved in cell wall biosynthesis
MRILVITQYFHPESASISTICEAWVRLGHHVQVLTSKPEDGFGQIPKDYIKIKDEVVSGVNIHRVQTFAKQKSLWSRLRNFFTFYQASIKAVEQLPGRYDVVISVGYPPLTSVSAGIKYAKKHHLPHVLYVVDPWPESMVAEGWIQAQGLLFKWFNRWRMAIYRSQQHVVVSSESLKHEVSRYVEATSIHPDVINLPAQVEQLTQDGMDYGEGFHLVYVGRFEKTKRLDILIKTWEKVPKLTHLHLVGEGSQLPNLKAIVKQKNLGAVIHFYAHQTPENVGKFLQASDAIFVGQMSPTIVGKVMPSSLAQALAFGKPIISAFQGDGLKVLKALPRTFQVDATMKSLPLVLQRIKKLTTIQLEALTTRHLSFYRENLSAYEAAKAFESYFKSLIQVKRS